MINISTYKDSQFDVLLNVLNKSYVIYKPKTYCHQSKTIDLRSFSCRIQTSSLDLYDLSTCGLKFHPGCRTDQIKLFTEWIVRVN